MAEYIEREALLKDVAKIGGFPWSEWETAGVFNVITKQPIVDVVPVVRCKDCIVSYCLGDEDIVCGRTCVNVDADDFCSYGERKDGEG